MGCPSVNLCSDRPYSSLCRISPRSPPMACIVSKFWTRTPTRNISMTILPIHGLSSQPSTLPPLNKRFSFCSYSSFNTLTCTTVEDICRLRKDGRLYHHECCRQRRAELQENFADVLGIRISATQGKFHVVKLEHPGEDEWWYEIRQVGPLSLQDHT